ncbi:glycosyltransferase [Muricoccus pecuniae]|uniref:Glycosyltransferase involved in cell wall biosynthesis n=1 Tax=Muricoccus pecuniae TaxID=693023 RepID=A0A840YKW4_9PROT|nr:glycosyltransferase [Roseomonas pecuniae]MBB5694914.1 glycosyltransferase involved in cell wall biosynthesis [Roseomonas pecuniae]
MSRPPRPSARPRIAPSAAGEPEAPLVLMLSAAHPPTDLRIVGKEGAALAAAGWRVTHLAPAPLRGAKEVPAESAGVRILTYPRPTGWLGRLRAARALARRAARLKPEVIHAHEPDSWYAAILAARRNGAAVVLDVHEHYPSRLDARLPRPLRGLGRRAVRAACRWMAARADAVVVAKDGLEDAFPGTEIVPVRNYAAAVPVRPREHGPGPLTLVHLGALTRERGAFEMLQALSRSPEGTRLSLIGRFTDGCETDFLSEAKRLGLSGAVERHGWLPHEAAVARAAEADIGLVLFQPGHENHRLALPHKLFDCMLAGLPVIVPDFAEEVAAVVREAGCGLLVDTADPGRVAEAVRELADPALRARLGAAGRAAALGRFGWAGEAERLVRLYAELAPLPAGARPEVAPAPALALPAVEPSLPAPPPAPAPSVPVPPVPEAPLAALLAWGPGGHPLPGPSAALPGQGMGGLPPAAPSAAPAPAEALPRLLLDAGPGGVEAVPPSLVALLSRASPEPAPGPPPVSPAPAPAEVPPSRVLGPAPPPALPELEPRAAGPTASAALGAMVHSLRNAPPPMALPEPAKGAAPDFALLAGLPAPGPALPSLTGRPVEAPPEGAGLRLLAEAGLSDAPALPASMAAMLGRAPEMPPPAAAPAPVTSDVPLIEAGLRAAEGTGPAEPASPEWRLLQPASLPPGASAAVAPFAPRG